MAKKTRKKQGKRKSPGLRKIFDTPGMASKLAKALRITRQAVSDWDEVPINRLTQVERITGIPRAALRPDIFG